MKRIGYGSLLLYFLFLGQGLSAGGGDLKLYFVDVGWGGATLIVSPSGRTMLIDTGPVTTAGKVLDVFKLAGVQRIDQLVITHYHWDHNGALAELAAHVPIQTTVDHGPNVELGKSDDWWKQRRHIEFI